MRRALALALLFALAFTAMAEAQSQGPAAAPPQVRARSWIVIDARTGEALASRAPARRLPIASATKLMTAHLALERLPLARRVAAPFYPAVAGESLLGLSAGQRISVRDLLYALVLRSANDAAFTLAEAISGSVGRFVGAMNRSASALGLVDTHYANPIGLDQAGNYSSAADLVVLARRLLRRRAFRRIADARHALLRSLRPPRPIDTRNTLLYRAPWATGIKTGHTLAAGYVLVGSGRRKGVELISAVLGAPSEPTRDLDSLRLLDYGFSLYRTRRPVRRGQVLASPDIRYAGGELALRATRTLAVGARRDQQVDLRVIAPDEVEGPIRRGARLGRVKVTVDGLRSGGVPLVATRSIGEAGWFDVARSWVEDRLALVALAVIVIAGVAVVRRRRDRRRRNEEEMRESREERRRIRQENRRNRVGGPR
jgi:serine-type D-Ala-D-Ala carboxypeptidase (penicillin-binding protein 5/6)